MIKTEAYYFRNKKVIKFINKVKKANLYVLLTYESDEYDGPVGKTTLHSICYPSRKKRLHSPFSALHNPVEQ